MNHIDQLLNEIKSFNKHKALKSSVNGENFNMFRICGVDHYENTHSAILAEILNPKGTHNFGAKFLEAFIKTLKRSELIEDNFDFSLQNVMVITENASVFGRLDILIRNSNNQALLLENKIYAGDQHNQLLRYQNFGKREFGNQFKLLYLTLQGNESNNTDKEIVDYIQVSYGEIILNWLERCIEISARSPIVRETLIQYANHIKSLTNNTTANIMSQELIDKLSTLENLEAAYIIADNLSKVRNNIINTVLLPQMHEIANELNLVFNSTEGDYVNTSWAGFGFAVPQYKNYNVFMEFGKRGLNNLIIGFVPKSENSDTAVFPQIKQVVGGGNNRCAFQKFPFHPNWHAEAMKAILTGEMKTIIKDKIQNLLEITKDIENI
ncbi:PD-(D/E)XK nuclease family protein [Empedobacter falsenii]|uniref:PD-(D/E)XK nuclease family protein n=1 Tax=Empedobacter falsenii TaxID=343874 RepID=A0AAW7DJU1_9FLAO|nr:PD-(D/E)XK nuclease family protein [Empedobacter falsenii]MDM1551848.1 PD-(D/E)XK nuclease family protein [Empedobacter falsenii]